MRRFAYLFGIAATSLMLVGCPKGNPDFAAGKRAESLQDYDTALFRFEKALKADPSNVEFKLRATRARYEAGQFHVDQGQKAFARADYQLALGEFQRAQAIDPSNSAADQGIRNAMEKLAQQQAANAPKPAEAIPPEQQDLATAPPQLKPTCGTFSLTASRDARMVFETIAKLCGLSVVFDPEFSSRNITVELPNVTAEQALDAVAFESKAFWKAMTSNIFLVAPEQVQKRRDLEDSAVQTFYLSNTLTPQDLTEIATGLRQLLDLTRVQQVNAQNAIVVRGTPAKLALAGRIIRNIDKARPEVLLHVQVLQARLDHMRNLGITPGQSAVLAFTPRSSIQPSTSSSSSSSSSSSGTQVTLQNLKHLSSADYSLTLPGAAVAALLNDSTTRIIQDPEVRVTDGENAKLKIGDRVPVATGSFQAGVGVGVGGTTGIVNPLVNTQFTYIDTGVNVEVTPRVHPDGDISLKLDVEVSSVTNHVNIGGIEQPVISQRKITHEVRLKEGEVSVLGGLIDRTVTKSLNGWPGVAHIPFLRYFFSEQDQEIQENEVLIAITPHLVRMPSVTAENVQSILAGTDTNVRIIHKAEVAPPAQPSPPQPQPQQQPPQAAAPAPEAPQSQAAPQEAPAAAVQPAAPESTGQLRFEPATVNLKVGDTTTVGVAVSNVHDLFSIPLLFQYDPNVVRVEEVRNGGFLSGGTQEIAIVQRIDQQQGQAIISATRQPNTPGVDGSGTLLGLVIRALAPGTAKLQIVQVNARDSQQHTIPLVAGEATIQVQ